jgi:Methyltransferase domain
MRVWLPRLDLRLRLRGPPYAVRRVLCHPGWLKEYVRASRERHHMGQSGFSLEPCRAYVVNVEEAVADVLGPAAGAEYDSRVSGLWKPPLVDDPLAYWRGTDKLQDLLGAIVGLVKPSVVVETGVAMGYTSAVVVAGIEADGTGALYSIDVPALKANGREFTGKVVPRHLGGRWTLRLGPSRQLLPARADELAPIGPAAHNADHSYGSQIEEYRTTWPKLEEGGSSSRTTSAIPRSSSSRPR